MIKKFHVGDVSTGNASNYNEVEHVFFNQWNDASQLKIEFGACLGRCV